MFATLYAGLLACLFVWNVFGVEDHYHYPLSDARKVLAHIQEPGLQDWFFLERCLQSDQPPDLQSEALAKIGSFPASVNVPDSIYELVLTKILWDQFPEMQRIAVRTAAQKGKAFAFSDVSFKPLLFVAETGSLELVVLLWDLISELSEKRRKQFGQILFARLSRTTDLDALVPTPLMMQLLPSLGLESLLEHLEKNRPWRFRERYIIRYLSLFPFDPRMEKPLFEALASNVPGLPKDSGRVLGKHAAAAAPLIPKLIDLATSDGEERFAAVRALVLLSPFVPAAEAFERILPVYRKEVDPRGAEMLTSLICFADASTAEGREFLEKERSSFQYTSTEESLALLAFCRKNVAEFRKELLGVKGSRARRLRALLALLTVPWEEGRSEWISALRVLLGDSPALDFDLGFFAEITELREFDLGYMRENFDALLECIEDPAELFSFKVGLLEILRVSGSFGVRYLPRLRAIDGEKIRFHMEGTIRVLDARRRSDFRNRRNQTVK